MGIKPGLARKRLFASCFVIVTLLLAIVSVKAVITPGTIKSDIVDLLFREEVSRDAAHLFREKQELAGRTLLFTFAGKAAQEALDAFLVAIDGRLELESVEASHGEERFKKLVEKLFVAHGSPPSKRWLSIVGADDPATEFNNLLHERVRSFSSIVPLRMEDDPFLFSHEYAREVVEAAVARRRAPSGSNTTGLVITLADRYQSHTPTGEIERTVSTLLDDACLPRGATCEWSGFVKFAADSESRLREEVGFYSLVAAIVTALTALVLFRSLRQVFIAVIVVATGFVWGLGITVTFLGSVHLVTLGFGSALMGVSVDYLVHYFVEQLARPRGTTSWAVRDAIIRPISFGMLTSGVVFAVLSCSGFPGLREIAIFSGVGLFGAYLAVVLFVPVLSGGAAGRADATVFLVFRKICKMAEVLSGRGGLIIAALAVIGCVPGLFLLRCSDDIRNLQEPGEELLSEHRRVLAVMGMPTRTVQIVQKASSFEELLVRADVLKEKLELSRQRSEIDSYEFPLTLFKLDNLKDSWNREVSKFLTTHRDALLAVLVEFGVSEKVLVRATEQINTSESREWFEQLALDSSVVYRMQDGQYASQAVVATSTGTIPSYVLDGGGATIHDPAAKISERLSSYRRQSMSLLAIAYCLVYAALVYFLGSRAGVRVILPSLLTGVAVLAGMGYLGVQLSFFHVVALVIVLGLSVDYALFFLEAKVQEQAVVGVSVALSTFSTVLAFLPLCFSSSGVLRGLGGTLGLGILLATFLAPMASCKQQSCS